MLRSVELFAGLDVESLAMLAARARFVSVDAGTWLFEAGDPGHELMAIWQGRVEVHVPDAPPGLSPRLLGRGDVIGELALLGEPVRSASVRARRDTTLLALDRAAVVELFTSIPEAALSMARGLADQLRTSVGTQRSAALDSVIALVALDPDVGTEHIAAIMADELGRTTVMVQPEGDDPTSFAEALGRAEQNAERVILVASAPTARRLDGDPWSRFCSRSADRLIAVVCPDRPPNDAMLDSSSLQHVALAIVDRSTPPGPQGAAAEWIDALHATTWFRLGTEGEIEAGSRRMARRIGGSAPGIVLSGGGARGFAHIGVLQALDELGVTIDRIGGCSMGALVAALVASGAHPTDLIEPLHRGFTRRNTLGQVALSRTSLLRADRLDRLLTELLGRSVYEQFPISAFAVSADLLTAKLVEHRRGGVAAAVRASMAIPGLLPPISAAGRVLVDGGLLDNLPVASMAHDEGPILAIDVTRDSASPSGNHPPGLVETLTRAALLGRRPRVARSRNLAHTVIAPDVRDVGLLDFQRIDAAVEAGRLAVLQAAEAGELDALVDHEA